ncbi:MAG: PRC-barrel domain-containing protein [Caulobacterales bacterium]
MTGVAAEPGEALHVSNTFQVTEARQTGGGQIAMLRSMTLALVLATAGAALAHAEQAPRAEGLEIRSETGERVGRVRDVRRDENGRVTSVSVSGLEAPADAPPHVMAQRPSSTPVIIADTGSPNDDQSYMRNAASTRSR